MKGILIRVVIILIAVGVLFYWYKLSGDEINPDDILLTSKSESSKKISDTEIEKKITDGQKTTETKNKLDNKEKNSEKQEYIVTNLEENVKNDVPFILQAPKSQWTDEKFQDACEEASILMAYRWKENKGGLSKNSATKELEKMFEAERSFFGPKVLDTSAEDTMLFANEYFGKGFEIKDASLSSMYSALANGFILIVPTNGKMLNNPNFTNGGPERHMLVITGYDKRKKEFITNDPGTKKGEDYRYPRSRLFNAIRDYKTGYKEPIKSIVKNMIIVKK